MKTKILIFFRFVAGFAILPASPAINPAHAADVKPTTETFRTDINPASLYYQAFLLAPELQAADRDLFWTDWRGQKLPDRFGEIVTNFDSQFALVRRAAHSTVPCDWGIDMSAGPATALTQLARAKAVTQSARLRAAWLLQQGRPAEACEDLLAAFVLGRNVSRDGTLISTLVQIAIEAIVCNGVAEKFYQFPVESLQQLEEGMAAAPARGTVAGSLPNEKAFFLDWIERKILSLRKAHPGNDADVMDEIRQLFQGLEGEAGGGTNWWQKLSKAAGGTSDGVLKLLHERGELYEEIGALCSLSLPEFQRQFKELSARAEKSDNPLLAASLPAFGKSRVREFRILAELAIVRAAIEYKLRGEAGLKSVNDPCGDGPLAFKRFVFEGKDRGFELASAFDDDGRHFALVFVKNDGPPFYVDGPKIGQPVQRTDEQEQFRRRYGLESGTK